MLREASIKALLVVSWLLLFGTTLEWLLRNVLGPGSRTSAFLLGGAGVLLIVRRLAFTPERRRSRPHDSLPRDAGPIAKVRDIEKKNDPAIVLGHGEGWSLRHSARSWLSRLCDGLAVPLRARPFPMLVVVGTAAAFVFMSHTIDVHTLAAFLFVLCTYGLVGLFLPPAIFRQGLPLAILFAAVLPVGRHIEMFIGFSARALTAEVVEGLLAAWRIPALSAQSILFLESGTAYVDEPCSGLRSLWSGAIFFLALTYVHRSAIGLRWFGVAAVHFTLLSIANVIRVLSIVLLSVHADLPRLAHALHETLGLVGFVWVCAATHLLARRFWKQHARERRDPTLIDVDVAVAVDVDRRTHRSHRIHGSMAWVAVSLSLVLVLAWAALGEAPLRSTRPAPVIDVRFPSDTELSLSDGEHAFFARVGGASAKKRRFELGSLTGTSIVVSSTIWSAHHPPEACLSSAGFRIDAMRELRVNERRGGTIRVASVDRGSKAAVYWFQSPSATTGNLLERIWRELRHREDRWVMISILLDGPLDRDEASVRRLFSFVHERVEHALSPSDAEDLRR